MRNLSALVLSSIALLSPMDMCGEQPTSLSGRLSASESPLADCTVSLYRLDADLTKYVENIVTRTGASGNYGFPALVPGKYIYVALSGQQRIFQGMLDIDLGPNVKDISFPDPFVGFWQLDKAKSHLPGNQVNELREYRRNGDKISVSWKITLANKNEQQGSYELRCDNKEYRTNSQQIACRFVDPYTVEGYQKPPLSYYVRRVAGDTLTIVGYTDEAHKKVVSTFVFERIRQ